MGHAGRERERENQRGAGTHVAVGEVVDLEHVDDLPHFRPLEGVGVNTAERHQEGPLQGPGRGPLAHLGIQDALGVPVAHHRLQPVHQVNLKDDRQGRQR